MRKYIYPIPVSYTHLDVYKRQAWNRFRLRGLEKVKTEFTLVAIAHNLRKLAKKNSFRVILPFKTLNTYDISN